MLLIIGEKLYNFGQDHIISKIINTTAKILPENIKEQVILTTNIVISVAAMNTESQNPYAFVKNNILGIAGLSYMVANYATNGKITKGTIEYIGGERVKRLTRTKKERKHQKFVDRMKKSIAGKMELQP